MTEGWSTAAFCAAVSAVVGTFGFCLGWAVRSNWPEKGEK